MYFVYILRSILDPSKHYVGITQNIPQRLKEHNNGESLYTKEHRPWKAETYIAFSNKDLAASFEKYLKRGSGHAFLRKRLIQKP